MVCAAMPTLPLWRGKIMAPIVEQDELADIKKH
jgi:hypothetical protein